MADGGTIKNYIRRLDESERIPYDILLLADESISAINKYVRRSRLYVYENKDELIAIYALLVVEDGVIELKNIAVKEDFQRKGIGTLLIKDAIIRAQKEGFNTLLIGTGDGSEGQLRLYQKLGFVIYDKKVNFFVDNYPMPIFENGMLLKDMIMLKIEF